MNPIKKIAYWAYWGELVRVVTFFMVAFIAVFAVSAYRNSQANVNRLLKEINNNTATIKTQSDTITGLTKQIKSDTDSIHSQADCIFLFFSQPQTQRDTTSVTYPPECVVPAGSGGPSSRVTSLPAATVQPKPTTAPTTASPPATSTTSSPTPAKPKPTHPLACTVTLGLVGCK